MLSLPWRLVKSSVRKFCKFTALIVVIDMDPLLVRGMSLFMPILANIPFPSIGLYSLDNHDNISAFYSPAIALYSVISDGHLIWQETIPLLFVVTSVASVSMVTSPGNKKSPVTAWREENGASSSSSALSGRKLATCMYLKAGQRLAEPSLGSWVTGFSTGQQLVQMPEILQATRLVCQKVTNVESVPTFDFLS